MGDENTAKAILQALHQHREESQTWRDGLTRRLDSQDARIGKVAEQLERNTEITETIGNVLAAGKVATWLIKWLGAIGMGVAGIAAAIFAFKSGGNGNGGIGPTQ